MTDLNPMEGVIEYFRAKGTDVDDQRADLMEQAHRIILEARETSKVAQALKLLNKWDFVELTKTATAGDMGTIYTGWFCRCCYAGECWEVEVGGRDGFKTPEKAILAAAEES